jgi:hypothetical protein
MESMEQKGSGFAGILPAVDIEHPGLFPYARFSHSSARNRRADVQPLSQNSEFAVWPNVVNFKAAGAGASSRRK